MPKRSQPVLPRVKKLRKHLRQGMGAAGTSFSSNATETWAALGSCAASMGIYPLALKAYEAALAHSPGLLTALLGWLYLLRMNDVAMNETVGCQAAMLRLTQAADRFPELAKAAEFFKELSECYLLVNLNDPAQQAIQQAIQLQPHDASLFLLLAQALIRLGLRAQAALLLLHCLKLLPKSLALFLATDIETARTAHAELAAIAAADGNIDALINELTATLMLPPPLAARASEHIALWCALATALERANKIPEALDACERAELAVGLLPRILITHAYLLLLDELRPRAERAVELLTRVVETEPRLPPSAETLDANSSEDSQGDFLPWCLLGKAYTLLDSPRAAYDAYQIALRRADGLPITWLAVGKLYLELKQLPDALAAYSQALRLQLNENSPGTAAAWDGLSCVYERCDDQLGDAADACLRAALCFQAYGDAKSAEFYEDRAKTLRLAAAGKAAVPDWSEPVGVPNYFLRDLVNLLPTERIAFVKGINKTDSQNSTLGLRKQEPTSPTLLDRSKSDSSKVRQVAEAPLYAEHTYPPRAQPPYAGRQLHPYDVMARRTPGPAAETPPPAQPQYVHPGTPSHVMQGGQEHLAGPPHAYALAPPFKQDAKLPAAPAQPLQHQTRHYWLGPDQANNPAHPVVRVGPPFAGHYGPPPASMMSPPGAGQGPATDARRSPAAHPQVPVEGYPVAMPPGYAYGQYMPMHAGMVAQVPPYGATHWRR